jgi:hypothetical protein
MTVTKRQTYRFSQDNKLKTRLKTEDVVPALFSLPDSDDPLKGEYQLLVTGTTFEPDSDIDVEFVSHGQVYGLAGTDQSRRDLMVPCCGAHRWPWPSACWPPSAPLVLTMVIAAIGTWYGGWVDELIQRITEINLVLPFLSILIMVGTFYSRSIWVILGVTILLSIFTGAIKGYRSIFLQVKESDVYRSGARLRRQRYADCFCISDPAHDPAADPGAGLLRACVCVPGGLPGGAGTGRPRPADLGQDHPGRQRQRRALPRLLLLDHGACRAVDGHRPGLCHARFCTGPGL